MQPLRNEISEALSFDAIAELERATGISYKDDENIVWASMALQQKQQEKTNALLYLTDDVNSWNQTLGQWMDVVGRMGFDLLLCEEIPTTPDFFRVFWHPEGVLLVCDSYSGDKTVNGGNAYWQSPFKEGGSWISKCSSSPHEEPDGSYTVAYSKDCRDALRHTLSIAREDYGILPQWTHRPWLWLLHYMDTKTKGYDYNAINNARIAKLPASVQKAICA